MRLKEKDEIEERKPWPVFSMVRASACTPQGRRFDSCPEGEEDNTQGKQLTVERQNQTA